MTGSRSAPTTPRADGVGAEALEAVRAAVAAAAVVVPVGGRTHWEVGGPPPSGTEVRAPAGVVAHEPAELTVTVGAGTTVGALAAALAEAGQECPLDPRSPAATVGGVLATGLSGPRRLRYGPVRDTVLEVRFVTGDARLVKGGGPTVKNVSGYDLPRLLVGSFGTLGVIVQATLRCRPRPARTAWAVTDDPEGVRRRLHAPSALLWDGAAVHVRCEGDPADVDAELRAGGLEPTDGPPAWPDGPHRGRLSVRPRAARSVGVALDALAGCRWLAELGVGTVHVATDDVETLAAAREVAAAAGGWLLREAGGDGLDGFGVPDPGGPLARRIRAAFDPAGKCAPGRMPA